jgi:hypothetical protein
VAAPLEMKEGTTLWARAQSALELQCCINPALRPLNFYPNSFHDFWRGMLSAVHTDHSNRYVATDPTSDVSFSAINNDITEASSKSDNLGSVNLVLRTVNKETVSPLCMYRLDRKLLKSSEVILPYKPNSYIIFVWPAKEHSRLLDSVSSQLNVFVQKYILTHGRGLLSLQLATARKTTDFLRTVFDMLWFQFKVENFIIVLPSLNHSLYSINENVHRLVEMKDYDIFSCFPYETNHCGEHFQAVLMDKCYMENVGELSHNLQLFTNKISNNFAVCCMSALVPSTEPYSMAVINDSVARTVSLISERYTRLIQHVSRCNTVSVA